MEISNFIDNTWKFMPRCILIFEFELWCKYKIVVFLIAVYGRKIMAPIVGYYATKYGLLLAAHVGQ